MNKIHDTIRLPRAKAPENVGISSEAVLEFTDKLNKSGFKYHSFMIVRHGVVAAECYRFPFNPDTAHIAYSISKSVGSIATGFAINEGYLSLETRVADIFPEYAPKEYDEYFEKLTLHHLLSMTAGKNPSYFLNKTKNEWINHFTDAQWAFEPGEQMKYINENIFMVCAMLTRTTGMSVTEFLTPRLWEPLGINVPYWETDPNGIESGGWGLYLTLESMAKIIYCVSNGGIFNGQQVIPADWIEKAKLNYTKSEEHEIPNKEAGYGYCFWRRDSHVYSANGVFGQRGIIYEDKDTVFIMQSGDPVDKPFNEVLSEVEDRFFTEEDPSALPDPEFVKRISSNVFDTVPFSRLRSFMEFQINGKVITLETNNLANTIGFPPSILSLPAVYMTKNRAGNINDVTFEFFDDTCTFEWYEGDERNKIVCGMDGKYRYTQGVLGGIEYTLCAAAAWLCDEILEVMIRPLESVGRKILRFNFNNGEVKLELESCPTVNEILGSLTWTVTETLRNQLAQKIAIGGVMKIQDILEHTLEGKYRL